jgi:branched-subunit amino acid aminotransferase/4-amino-4-deoxychorismate lyase
MRLLDGILLDWDLHYDRLHKGVEFLYGPFNDGDDWPYKLKNRLEAKFLDLSGDKILRLSVYREQSRGLIRSGLISVTDLKIHLSNGPLDQSRYIDKTIKLRTCPAPVKAHWWPSFLKAGNYLETILAQKMYMRPGDDDVLFLSQDDTVLESSVANIFVVKHDKLYTAPLGPNVLDGVMRKKIIQSATEIFKDVDETETTMEQLLKADAVFGCNSVRGPFIVDRIDDHDIKCNEDFKIEFERLKSLVFK